MKYTRKQYMENVCTHDQYYSQFVSKTMTRHVIATIGKQRILNSKDENFNDIPLIEWDNLSFYVNGEKMRWAGESPSLCAKVCIAKQAAKHIKNSKAA